MRCFWLYASNSSKLLTIEMEFRHKRSLAAAFVWPCMREKCLFFRCIFFFICRIWYWETSSYFFLLWQFRSDKTLSIKSIDISLHGISAKVLQLKSRIVEREKNGDEYRVEWQEVGRKNARSTRILHPVHASSLIFDTHSAAPEIFVFFFYSWHSCWPKRSHNQQYGTTNLLISKAWIRSILHTCKWYSTSTTIERIDNKFKAYQSVIFRVRVYFLHTMWESIFSRLISSKATEARCERMSMTKKSNQICLLTRKHGSVWTEWFVPLSHRCQMNRHHTSYGLSHQNKHTSSNALDWKGSYHDEILMQIFYPVLFMVSSAIYGVHELSDE